MECLEGKLGIWERKKTSSPIPRVSICMEDDPPPSVICLAQLVGVSTWRSQDTSDSLISRADEALYRANGSGRNIVKVEE